MPVGDYTKEEIRAMAEKIGLRTANKPDSQEICFDARWQYNLRQCPCCALTETPISHNGYRQYRDWAYGHGDYAGFIEREQKGKTPPPGNFVTRDGEILGQHKGITHYTIGQRKGLGIAMSGGNGSYRF